MSIIHVRIRALELRILLKLSGKADIAEDQ